MNYRSNHNRKMNFYFLIALAVHLPVFLWLTIANKLPMMNTLLFFFGALSLPTFLYVTKMFENALPSVMAFTTMCFSALLIHLGNGMIELHFHIFMMLAAFVAFGLMTPVLVGVVTIALHHISFFLFIPDSIFNYKANFGIVLLHATFVILEAIPALYIANQFKKMIDLQDSAFGSLDSMSESITHAIQNIHQTGIDLSSRTNGTAAALEETSASVEELSSMVSQNSKNAQEASKLSLLAKESASLGDRDVRTLMETMNLIHSSAKKMEDIINVIDDLSFQTNLLALNAAVEAARAGEQGRGFAVVAEAVRGLAQRSAVAAKDIHTLIQASGTQVDKGVTAVSRSEKSLKELLGSIEKVATLNVEIADASEQQSQSIHQISKAVIEIDKSAQANSNTTSEISEMSAKIKEESDRLKHIVEHVNEKLGLVKSA